MAATLVHPAWQGRAVGSALYAAREDLVRRLGLLRIRARARGFRMLAVTSGYLRQDPESLGKAAVIEWLNPDARPAEDASPPEQPTAAGSCSCRFPKTIV